jgi:peptidyl-prolyl cis-trans isomerase C
MSDKVTASHILLMYAGSERSTASRSKEDAKTQIEDLKGQLASGTDFGELAGAHSDCPSGRSGGSLGPFGRGQMVGAFEDTAFGLEVGATSDVVETPFGFHLIQRTA